MKAFYNNTMLEEQQIAISPDDLIVQRGYGIFDFFRIASGVPLFMRQHLQRFQESADKARIPFEMDIDTLADRVNQLMKVNNQETGGIKLILTGGISPMGLVPSDPNLIIIQNKAKISEAKYYAHGTKLISREYMRELPEVKTTNYFQSVWLHPEIKNAQALDVLYYAGEHIFELSRSNIFLIKNGIVITPDSGVLQGITRGKVLELSKKNWPTEVRKVTLSEVYTADEVFITSTLKKVMPVVKVDEKIIGDGKPGKMTREIIQLFDRLVDEYTSAK
ncbi:MAG: aminotransferase class IV [Cyclobacteriaceae bacterium]